MPQLRWTLLGIGVLFIILLAWIERRRQRRQGFSDSATVDRDLAHGASGLAHGHAGPAHGASEPALTLPEMRAARESAAPQELPVVEIEDDSLNARRVEVGEPLMDPPTLSLPIVDSGPEVARRRPSEPTVSDFDFKVPRLDTAAPSMDAPVSRTGTNPKLTAIPRPDVTAKPTNKINLADTYVGTGDSEERAFNDAVFGDRAVSEGTPSGGEAIPRGADPSRAAQAPSASPDSDEQHTQTDVLSKSGPYRVQSESRTQFLGGAAAPRAPAPPDDETDQDVPVVPRFTAADVTPVADPIVDWPPDDQRRVVSLRLVAPPTERFPGRALRLALASEGFVLGKFQIFHKPDESGRAVLSAANLSKPGTFDMATMDSQRYGGLSLFTVLPGPRAPLKAFEDLLTTARNLNERMNGALQDERGGPLTPTRIASLRDSLEPPS